MPNPSRSQLRWTLFGVVCAALVTAVLLFRSLEEEPAGPAARQSEGSVAATAAVVPAPAEPESVPAAKPAGRPLTVLSDAPFAREFGKEGTTPEREMELIQLAFKDYLQLVKERYWRPFGFNEEFVALMVGGNPYKIAPVPPTHPRINAAGQLTDRWGSAFHIHPLAADAIEIRSAGPDKQLWSGDDLHHVTISGQDLLDKMATKKDDEKRIDEE